MKIPKIKNIIDLSLELSPDSVVWPGDNHLSFDRRVRMADGALCNSSTILMSLHTATHADAPIHYAKGGKSMESVQLSRFCGPAKVYTVPSKGNFITRADLEKLEIGKNDLLLFKTANGEMLLDHSFHTQFVCFDLSAAKYLVEKGVRGVGVDYLSIEKYNTEDGLVHNTLLSHEIGVLEGLNLSQVKDGEYFLAALPLKIRGSDGSPVRAVLIEFE